MASIKKNDIITAEIEGMTSEGSGVAHYDGMAVFVPGSAPGDVAEIIVIKVTRSYAVGKIKTLTKPGAGRCEPDCPAFPKCGGCTFRHLAYAEECEIKRRRVNDAMKRIGGTDMEAEEFLPADFSDRYRNKAQIPFGEENGKAVFGFYAGHSHRMIPFSDCLLQPEIFGAIAQATANFINDTPNDVYDETTGKGRFRHLYIRRGFATGEIMVCAVVNANGLVREDEFVRRIRAVSPGIKSIVINSNREKTNVILGGKCRTAWGSDTIRDTLCGLTFEISPLSFYQVNRSQTEKLYRRAAEYAGLVDGYAVPDGRHAVPDGRHAVPDGRHAVPDGRHAVPDKSQVIFDLYCGTGTVGLSMATKAKRLYGIEIVPDAVSDAIRNAKLNHIDNAEFICGDAREEAQKLVARGIQPDVVIVDPPRKGCSEEAVELLNNIAPKRIVYISCDPATLARDVARLRQYGWQVERFTAVDMFPRTANVETVALLSQKTGQSYPPDGGVR